MGDRRDRRGREEIELIDVENLPEEEAEEETFFTEDKVEEIVEILQTEYEEAESEVAQLVPMWNKWRRQARNRRETERKDFPFPNSSNVSPPLAKIIVNTVAGKLINLFDMRKPFWTIQSMREDDSIDREKTKVLEKYLDILFKSPYELDGKKKTRKIIKEMSLIGFAWVKVPWVDKEWNFKKESEEGVTEDIQASLRKGPMIDLVPPQDFLYKRAWAEFEDIPVLFHDITLPWYEVQSRIAQGFYKDEEEKLSQFLTEELDESGQAKGERAGFQLQPVETVTITEARIFFDIDDDGVAEDLVITLHIKSGTVLRTEFNQLGSREFESITYIDESFSLEGSGTGESCEFLQDEADGIHNMRNDNMKIANTKMLAVKREGNVKVREKIYPGKIFRLGDPSKDIKEVNLGEVYPSSLQAEQMTLMYAERSTGMSDVMQGFSDPNLGTRDTYRGQVFRAQQGAGLLSATTESIIDSFSRIGRLIFQQLVLHKEEVIEKERKAKRLSKGEIETLEDTLKEIELEEIPLRLTFTIKTTEASESMESLRTNIINFTQMFSQFAQQIEPLAQKVLGPQAQQLKEQAPQLYKHWLEIYVGSAKLMKRVFELFGHEEAMDYVPSTERQEEIRDLLREMNKQMSEMQNVPKLGGSRYAEGNVGEGRAGGATGEAGAGGPAAGGTAGAGTPQGGPTGPPEL